MSNVSEELSRLAALRDSGVLTEEEFQTQKMQVLASGSATRPTPLEKAAKKKGNPVLGCIGLIVVLIVLALIFAPKTSTDEAAPAAATKAVAPIEVTSLALSRAYEANEAAAQQQFGNKPLLVSGIVQGIDLDMTNDPVVQLNSSNEFLHVQVNLLDADKPKAAGLAKGNKITVLCQAVSEVMSAPILKDCAIK